MPTAKPLGTAGGTSQDDDADLEDLLTSSPTLGRGGKGRGGTAEVGIDLDHLTRKKTTAPPSSSRKKDRAQRYRNYGPRGNYDSGGFLSALCAHVCLFCAHRPLCGWICALGGVAALAYALAYLIDPTKEVGVVKHDWTNVQSEMDLRVGDIDHWCLSGGDSNCRCEDPLVPADRGEYKSWTKAHAENKRLIEPYTADAWDTSASSAGDIDVAFLGESLVEEMDGRWLGLEKGEHLQGLAKMFNKRFKRESGSDIEGLALGIAGDTAPNVLWRLLHGELPDGFHPRVWWVSLGMNDLARMQCSEEVVIMGIIRVVEELRIKRPDAKIVIQSMLPMSDFRGGAYPTRLDYKDAFREGPARRGRLGRLVGGVRAVDETHIAHRPNESRMPGGGRKRRALTEVNHRVGASDVRREMRWKKPEGKHAEMTPQIAMTMTDLEKKRAELIVRHVEELKRAKEIQEEQDEKDEKVLQKHLRTDRFNPTLQNRNRFKKLDPKMLFLRHTQLPLWPAISAINSALQKFSEHHEKVTFFDATDIFAERIERGSWMLLTDRISHRGHPTEEGFERWEGEVAKKLGTLLEKDRKKREKRDEGASPWVEVEEDQRIEVKNEGLDDSEGVKSDEENNEEESKEEEESESEEEESESEEEESDSEEEESDSEEEESESDEEESEEEEEESEEEESEEEEEESEEEESEEEESE